MPPGYIAKNLQQTRSHKKHKRHKGVATSLCVLWLLLLAHDLLEERNVCGFGRLLEGFDVREQVGAILIRDDLRTVQWHLVRSRSPDVDHETIRMQNGRGQPSAIARLSRVAVTLPAAIFQIIRF